MRRNIKNIIAIATSITLAASMLVGINIKSIKAEDNLLTDSWTHIHESYETNDALIANTSVTNTTDGFTANISITGWQRNWYGVDYMPDDAWPYADGWADNPYQLRSYTTMNVTPKSTYQLSFDIQNDMTSEVGNPTEKNVTVTVDSGIDGDTDNTFLFTTVRVPANGTFKFDRKFTIPESYTGETVMVEIAYGAYAYSYEVSSSSMIKLMPADVIAKYVFAPGTTEDVNAKGKLAFSNINVVQTEYEEPTTTTVTKEEETTTVGGQTCTCNAQIKECTCGNTSNVQACTCNHSNDTTATVKKPAKVSIKSAKNLKGKKLRLLGRKLAELQNIRFVQLRVKRQLKRQQQSLTLH